LTLARPCLPRPVWRAGKDACECFSLLAYPDLRFSVGLFTVRRSNLFDVPSPISSQSVRHSMDSLFDFSQPFDVALLERIVQAFNKSTNEAEVSTL